MKKIVMVVFVMSMFFSLAGAEGEIVGSLDATVCCEETVSGLFCQDIPEAACAQGSQRLPTACESTSFCNPGFCFDSQEGTCLGNVAESVCRANNGTWSETKPAACELGCCILGDQASFVTLTRCKRLSSFLGLETNYNGDIESEAACILTAAAEERGACVYLEDFEVSCSMTTRSGCTPEAILGGRAGSQVDSSSEQPDLGLVDAPAARDDEEISEEEILTSPEEGEVIFHPGMLCSSDSLGTVCGPSEETTCLPGKEGVYFIDTCGNPANIYDASRINDDFYWSEILDVSESCNPGSGNANSQTCGNCNYLEGTFCRESSSSSARPTYGENICQSLNCVDSDGVERQHGESWCGFDEDTDFAPRQTGLSGVVEREAESIADAFIRDVNSEISSVVSQAVADFGAGQRVSSSFLSASGGEVGSRYFRNVCLNGEIVVEPCADFRQEECIENTIDTPSGEFVEAACRVNRWQDCTAQTQREVCVNTDVRDCKWLEGIQYVLMGSVFNGSSIDGNSLTALREQGREFELGNRDIGACVPEHPPGLKFWDGEDAQTICTQASGVCQVTYEKGIGEDWECVSGCECLPGGTLEAERAQLCMALGDCGPKVNIAGVQGRSKGYSITVQDLDDD